jgi:hypothetical protein
MAESKPRTWQIALMNSSAGLVPSAEGLRRLLIFSVILDSKFLKVLIFDAFATY